MAGSGVVGLDIGCGANCIYPLIGAASCGWRFVGTDITTVAVTWARRNVAANPRLQHLIEVDRLPRPATLAPAQQTSIMCACNKGDV